MRAVSIDADDGVLTHGHGFERYLPRSEFPKLIGVYVVSVDAPDTAFLRETVGIVHLVRKVVGRPRAELCGDDLRIFGGDTMND